MLDGRCFTKEEKGRERRELKCLVSAAFSESWPEFKHTDEQPRCESSLASLRLIWSKVIQLLGRDQHCGRTGCAGGEHTIEQLWWFSNKRRADQLQTLWASRDFSVLYKDVSLQRRGGTRRPKKNMSDLVLSLECLSSPSLYLLHEFPVISSQQVSVLKQSDEVSQMLTAAARCAGRRPQTTRKFESSHRFQLFCWD